MRGCLRRTVSVPVLLNEKLITINTPHIDFDVRCGVCWFFGLWTLWFFTPSTVFRPFWKHTPSTLAFYRPICDLCSTFIRPSLGYQMCSNVNLWLLCNKWDSCASPELNKKFQFVVLQKLWLLPFWRRGPKNLPLRISIPNRRITGIVWWSQPSSSAN